MKQKFNRFLSAVCIAAFLFLSFSSCKKDGGTHGVDYGDAPRKPVPAELIGDWSYTSVSGTNVVDNNGHSVPAWTFGAHFHIEAQGTGFETIATSVTTTSSPTQEEDVNTDGTYVIESNADGSYSFKYYPVSGKVYDNDVFSHNLTPDKVYPNGTFIWTVTIGEDTKGKYFDTGDAKYYKD